MRTLLTVLTLLGLSAAAASAADAKAGQAVYDEQCKSCHGATGAPSAKLQKNLKITMKDLRAPEVQSQTDPAIRKTITDGIGKMKPVDEVTGPAVDNVVAYVRTLKK